MASSRGWKILRRIGIGILVTPFLVWIGISVGVKLTVGKDMPFGDVLAFVGMGLAQNVTCSITTCEAELLEGMASRTFDDALLRSTPVALDVDEWGRVLVAETGRQNKGAEDNRSHEYWLNDDLASKSVEDRRAYYQKWLDAGRFEDPDHFTSEYDRLVILEDLDGDGVADSRKVPAEWNDMTSGLASGVESREGTIWVTSIPSVYRIEDQTRDGEAESIEALHTGFGVKTSLIGHDLHGLAWGPDGKLYFSVGDRGYHVTLPEGQVLTSTLGPGRGAVFRMNEDGSELEVFATGVRNPQELAFDQFGNLFTGDNNGDGGDSARVVYVVEGGETGWAMPYQTLAGDYIRGPWVAEKLWELQHETQPAWVLPPVAHLGNGPSGFAYYPGLGLPERYANHFFLCDYAYMNGRSGIWSFELEPRGATFELVDRHKFAWSVLATDFDFSWDGRMFATVFDQIGLSQKILEWHHPESQADPRVAELERVAQKKMADREPDELFALLDFPDQRIRLRAQFELAKRREIDRLVLLAQDDQADLIPRLHALWAIGQVGAEGIRALSPVDLAWAADESTEFRAQLAKVVGEAGADWLAADLRGGLGDAEARVRFFSAQSLGALGDAEAMAALVDMVRENADQDVFVRHAAVWAMHRIGDLDAVWDLRADRSRSVRLAALLVFRQAGSPRVAHFLSDPDPLLVVEAARAIYDWPIESAMVDLAALAKGLEPVREDDEQTGQALHRRVLGANVRIRSEAGASALAAYVRDESQLERMRSIALEALGRYSNPPPRDLAMGFYRPLPPAAPSLLAAVFRAEGRALIESSLGSRALEIATEIGELPLDDSELLELVRSEATAPSEKVSALGALAARVREGRGMDEARGAIDSARRSKSPRVRIAGRDLLYALDPSAGVEGFLLTAESDAEEVERKHAWRRLGEIREPRAATALGRAIDAWEAGDLETALALEVIEAAAAQGGTLNARAARWTNPRVDPAANAVDDRAWALAGGDPEAGRIVFQTVGDCQRCHGAKDASGGGHGGGAGPSLAGVSTKGARYVLESVLLPSASIAEGFGSVVVTRKDGSQVSGLLISENETSLQLDVGGSEPVIIPVRDLQSRTDPTTGMPPMGLALEPRALRDVMAYVMSLD